MPMCCAYGCSNRSGRDKDKTSAQKELKQQQNTKITFHVFPKDPIKRNKWIKAIRRADWTLTRYSVICSVHFEEECIDRTSKSCVRLRETAIPTIFKGFPDYLKQVKVVQRTDFRGSIVPSDVGVSGSNENIDILNLPSTSSNIFEEKVKSRDIVPSDVGVSRSKVYIDVSNLPLTLSNASKKKKDIRKFKSRTTSFSPIHRMHRELSPSKAALINKLRVMKQRYTQKIRMLQQSKRRQMKQIANLSTVLKSLKEQ